MPSSPMYSSSSGTLCRMRGGILLAQTMRVGMSRGGVRVTALAVLEGRASLKSRRGGGPMEDWAERVGTRSKDDETPF